MKALVVQFVFYAIAINSALTADDEHSEDLEQFLHEDKDGNLQVEHLLNTHPNLTSSASDVTYFFYSKSNPDSGVEIHSNNVEKLATTSFTSKRKTVFLIHGWKESRKSKINSLIREDMLKDHDVNIFVVDWSPIAGKPYTTSQVREVGEYVADFVRSLINVYSLQLDKLTFVGYSLGAHVCGSAGAALNGQVDTIVGLDPAGPGFIDNPKCNRIDEDDAIKVQIIHTNGGTMGYYDPCGDSDFYVNGGSRQPGCKNERLGNCSHPRAYEIYAESLTSKSFVAQRCDIYFDDYEEDKCDGPKAIMGMFPIDNNASGSYYLKTNSESPYARG